MFHPLLSPYLDFYINYPIKNNHHSIPKKIIIYSPFNCGSNLLIKLLLSVFSEIEYIEIKSWKHTLEPIYHPDHLHILLIKNPFSWFLSIIKSPYHIEWDGNYTLFEQKEIKFDSKDSTYSTFSNIYQIWIHYYKKYNNFLNKTGNQYVMFLTYEDLLYHSDEVIKYFSKLYKIKLSLQYEDIIKKNLEKPAKDHGYCNNYENALHVNNKEYIISLYQRFYPNAISDFFIEIKNLKIHSNHLLIWKINFYEQFDSQ